MIGALSISWDDHLSDRRHGLFLVGEHDALNSRLVEMETLFSGKRGISLRPAMPGDLAHFDVRHLACVLMLDGSSLQMADEIWQSVKPARQMSITLLTTIDSTFDINNFVDLYNFNPDALICSDDNIGFMFYVHPWLDRQLIGVDWADYLHLWSGRVGFARRFPLSLGDQLMDAIANYLLDQQPPIAALNMAFRSQCLDLSAIDRIATQITKMLPGHAETIIAADRPRVPEEAIYITATRNRRF